MSLETRLSDLITAVGTDIKQLRTWITGSASGTLASLNTGDKSSIIAAINEVKATADSAGGGGSPASTTVAGIVELATLAEVTTGTDTTRAVTPEGVRQERIALKAEILGAGVPSALDTLDELAAALGDDANFASTVTTALGNRVRVDTAAQGLDSTQQGNARTNIAAVAAADIGNADANLVTLYTAAKA